LVPQEPGGRRREEAARTTIPCSHSLPHTSGHGEISRLSQLRTDPILSSLYLTPSLSLTLAHAAHAAEAASPSPKAEKPPHLLLVVPIAASFIPATQINKKVIIIKHRQIMAMMLIMMG